MRIMTKIIFLVIVLFSACEFSVAQESETILESVIIIIIKQDDNSIATSEILQSIIENEELTEKVLENLFLQLNILSENIDELQVRIRSMEEQIEKGDK